MSNPFLFFTRRTLIKGSLLSLYSFSGLAEASGATFLKARTLTPLGSRAIQVELTPLASAKAYIEYGSSSTSLSKKSALETLVKGKNKVVTLTSLSPNTTIYYRVRYAVGTSKSFLALPITQAKTSTENGNADLS